MDDFAISDFVETIEAPVPIDDRDINHPIIRDTTNHPYIIEHHMHRFDLVTPANEVLPSLIRPLFRCGHIYGDGVRCPLTLPLGGSSPSWETRAYLPMPIVPRPVVVSMESDLIIGA